MAFGASSKKGTKSSSSGSSGSYQDSGRSTKKGGNAPLPLKILGFCISLVIGAFIFANIKPYEVIAGKFLSSFDYPFLAEVLYNTPIIGGIIKFLTNFFSFGLGTALWAIFQILEILPLILFGHGRFLNNQIGKHGQSAMYAKNPNDSWETKAAKFLGNSLSTEVMRFLVLMAIGVYVLDFLLILSIYPPVQGNLGDFLYILQTSQWDKINWINLLTSVVVLFAVEFLIKLQGVVKQIIQDLD